MELGCQGSLAVVDQYIYLLQVSKNDEECCLEKLFGFRHQNFLFILLNYWTKLKYFFQCAQRCAVTELSSEHKITIAIFHRHFFGALVDFRASSVLTASCFFTRFTIFSIPFFLALVVFHKKIVIWPTPSAFITESLTLIHILPSFYLFFTFFCIHICGA